MFEDGSFETGWPAHHSGSSASAYLHVWSPILRKAERGRPRRPRNAPAVRHVAKTYGIGMVLGCVGVSLVKRVLRRIPFVGRVTAPVLAFVPTSVVGMLVGAGVTFGLERSDVDLRKAGQALCEGVSAAVEKLPTITDHLPELEASSQAGARKLADMVSSSVDMVSSGVSTAVSSVERELHTAPRPADLGTRQLHS
uniref:Uncharacterized protein n=1 Tax=Chlamydomonas euryale TaxID=1486919 RepID=A0A7R9YYY3_9CHLO|mmetsp:Transcript_34094/g.101387  ORF Transcript_34094/g.101387 Transcript_34094/m.101387 type:complete len:196 (+) Transcript_34094:226-813(+)